MDAQAGWYDDGSGRQRYWDGQQWTNNYGTPLPQAPMGLIENNPVAPILGYVGLGLAAIGTILACIPLTFFFGIFILLGAFVVSLIGVFKKNTAKWPSIVGMILSLIGGIIGTIVVVVIIASSLVSPAGPVMPVDTPSSNSAEPPSANRPSPDEIAVGFKELLNSQGMTEYNNNPEFYSCMGQYVYNSELSDETIKVVLENGDLTEEEWNASYEITRDGTAACLGGDKPSSQSGNERPSPDELAVGVKALINAGGITLYDNDPNFYSCMGQYFYDSELSDEALTEAAAGKDIVNEERELAIKVSTEAAIACDK